MAAKERSTIDLAERSKTDVTTTESVADALLDAWSNTVTLESLDYLINEHVDGVLKEGASQEVGAFITLLQLSHREIKDLRRAIEEAQHRLSRSAAPEARH